MNSINIYWGPDTVFEQATSGITVPTYLQDVLTHIGRAEIIIPGLTRNDEDSKPMEVEDLLIFTDDYGALREWALLGFTKNVLERSIGYCFHDPLRLAAYGKHLIPLDCIKS